MNKFQHNMALNQGSACPLTGALLIKKENREMFPVSFGLMLPFSGKASHKPPELNMTMPNIKEKEINKKKSLVSLTQSNRKPTEKNKESKTTLTKKDKDDHKDNKTKKERNSKKEKFNK